VPQLKLEPLESASASRTRTWRVGQIRHMDEVADTRAVRRGVVATVDLHRLSVEDRARHARDQMLFGLVGFAHAPLGMGT
jgi:hypothetical protein